MRKHDDGSKRYKVIDGMLRRLRSNRKSPHTSGDKAQPCLQINWNLQKMISVFKEQKNSMLCGG